MTKNSSSSTQLLWTWLTFFVTSASHCPFFHVSPLPSSAHTPSPAAQNSSAPSCAFLSLSLFPAQLLLLCVRPALIHPLRSPQGLGLMHNSLSVSHLSTLPPHMRLAFWAPHHGLVSLITSTPTLLLTYSLIDLWKRQSFFISMKF